MNSRYLATAAFAALVVGTSPTFAATLLIDNFNDDQRVEDAPSVLTTTNSQVGPSGNIIGGYRDLFVQTDSAGQPNATELAAQNGRLEFSNDTLVTGRGYVTYDGSNEVGADPTNVDSTGLGGIDFLTGLGAGFLFDIIAVDQPNIFIQIRAWDIFNNLVEFAQVLPAGGGNPFVPLEAFSGDPIDWHQVGALQFFAQTGEDSEVPALDGAIGAISVNTGAAVVPLPASLPLLFGAFGALGALRLRRRSA